LDRERPESIDPHRVLGVCVGASDSEVRAAWRAACFRHHPDAGGDGDTERLRRAREAFRALRDPARRATLERDDASGSSASKGEPPILSAANVRANWDWLRREARRLSRVFGRLLGG